MIKVKKISGISCKGSREKNEDYILYNESIETENRVVVLCDGMGGHGHGEIASKTIARSVYDYLLSIDGREYTHDDILISIGTAIQNLNLADVYDDEKKMGTTLVVAVINKFKILIGHIGDSRLYHFDENGIISFRTKDHSKVAEAVEAEILTEEEAGKSAFKNLLTRCIIAGKPVPKVDIDEIEINHDDRIMLCSDGVIDALSDISIQEIMVNRDIDDALSIIRYRCEEASHDNYSIIIADLYQDEVNKSSDNSLQNDNAETEEIEDSETSNNNFAEKVCHNCGMNNNNESKFCAYCGVELCQSDDIEQQNVQPSKTRLFSRELFGKIQQSLKWKE